MDSRPFRTLCLPTATLWRTTPNKIRIKHNSYTKTTKLSKKPTGKK